MSDASVAWGRESRVKACRALDDRACATVTTRSQRSPKASRSQSLCGKTSPGCSSGVGGRGSHPRPRAAPPGPASQGPGMLPALSRPPAARSPGSCGGPRARALVVPSGTGRRRGAGRARASSTRVFRRPGRGASSVTAAETLQTRRLSDSTGLFREGVSPLPDARQSVADTGGLGPSAGSSGDSKFPPGSEGTAEAQTL